MKKPLVFAITVAAGAMFGAHAAPAPAKPATLSNKNCEIAVTADNFTADLNAKAYSYIGNVIVTQCETKLRADTVHITTVNNQADKVNASGNVVVDSPKSGIATGQTGVYDVPHKMVTLNGNVVLKKNKDVMRGQQLTINLATGQANLGGGVKANAPGQQGGRVSAVFGANGQQ